MRVIYRLKDDSERFSQSQKAAVATESGFEATYGVVGSPEWWEKISSGELPVQTCSGIITKRYMGSWNDWPEFTMRSGSGEESNWSRFGHSGEADKYYKVGSRIEIDYVVQRLQGKALLPGEERKIVLEVRIGAQGPQT